MALYLKISFYLKNRGAMENKNRSARINNPGKRFSDFCANHETNTNEIYKHRGQWKLLLWILGIGIAAMSSIAAGAYFTQQQSMSAQQHSIEMITASVHSIDKMVTAYISGHTIEAQEGIRRLRMVEKEVIDLDQRVDILEKDSLIKNNNNK